MKDLLYRTLAAPPGPLWRRLLIGLAMGAFAILVRVELDPLLPRTTLFALFFLVIVASAVFAGVAGGVACLATTILASFIWITGPGGPEWPRVALFLFSSAVQIWLVGALRAAVVRLQAANTHKALLVEELQHRVKNILTVIQAMARQSFRSQTDPAVILESFSERLLALSMAHDLLREGQWAAVPLQDIATQVIRPFAPASEGRVRINGEPISVSADQVVGLALSLHELATNAIKYGALSTPDGVVELSWSRTGPTSTRIQWRERGGPAVRPPTRQGFGTRLLKQGLGLDGQTVSSTEFAPEGLCWTADIKG